MHKKKLILIFGCLFFLISFGFQDASVLNEKPHPPKPDEIKNILFYIQRSINISAIIYELNVDENQNLNINEPVKIYWINYASDGSIEPLNYIQKKYAYGIEIKAVDVEKKSFCFNFVSYKKKMIYLIKSSVDNKYNAFIEIGGKFVVLKKIFIQIEGGTFWVPKIKYIEIKGKDFTKNEDVYEKIIP
jgi:hypothetical protein